MHGLGLSKVGARGDVVTLRRDTQSMAAAFLADWEARGTDSHNGSA